MNNLRLFLSAKSSPRYYAYAYLACIPAFAAIYASIPGDFYHATAIHEVSLARDLEAIRAGVERAFNRHIAAQYGDDEVESGGWILEGNRIGIGGLEFKDGEFSCSVVMGLGRRGRGGPGRLFGTLATMKFGATSSPMIKDDGSYENVIKRLYLRSDGVVDFNPHVLLARPPAGFEGPPPDVKFLPMPAQLHDQIVAYGEAAGGFPAHSSGTPLRMLYFSAITITTLGFGDILPVSDRSRMAVSVEAILGIVIVGYYLASLAAVPAGRGSGGVPDGRRG